MDNTVQHNSGQDAALQGATRDFTEDQLDDADLLQSQIIAECETSPISRRKRIAADDCHSTKRACVPTSSSSPPVDSIQAAIEELDGSRPVTADTIRIVLEVTNPNPDEWHIVTANLDDYPELTLGTPSAPSSIVITMKNMRWTAHIVRYTGWWCEIYRPTDVVDRAAINDMDKMLPRQTAAPWEIRSAITPWSMKTDDSNDGAIYVLLYALYYMHQEPLPTEMVSVRRWSSVFSRVLLNLLSDSEPLADWLPTSDRPMHLQQGYRAFRNYWEDIVDLDNVIITFTKFARPGTSNCEQFDWEAETQKAVNEQSGDELAATLEQVLARRRQSIAAIPPLIAPAYAAAMNLTSKQLADVRSCVKREYDSVVEDIEKWKQEEADRQIAIAKSRELENKQRARQDYRRQQEDGRRLREDTTAKCIATTIKDIGDLFA